MQRRLLIFLVLASALATLVALVFLLTVEPPRPDRPVVQEPPESLPPPAEDELRAVQESGTLKGKVVNGADRNKAPIEGAKVIALVPYLQKDKDDDVPFWGEMREKRVLFTESDGTFELEDLPPDYWNLWVEKPGFSWTTVPRAKFDEEHVIELFPACRIRGRIVYPDNSPAEGIRIEYTPQGTHSEVFSRYRLHKYYLTTDAQGYFAYDDIPPGPFTVEAYSNEHLPAPWTHEPPLKPGEHRDLGTHKLDGGFGMTVRVLWRDTKEPVEGIEVVARPLVDPQPRTKTGRRIFTDRDGIARFAGLGGQDVDDPNFIVTAIHGDTPVPPDSGQTQPPGADVTIFLRKEGVVTGKVNRPNGQPLELFWVELRAKDFITRQLQAQGENGEFKVYRVPEGDYTLTVRYGNLIDQSKDVTMIGGGEVDVGTITLQEGAEIYGMVRQSNGKELEDIVRVHLAKKVWNERTRRHDWETVGRAICKKDGSYRIRGIPPGRFWIYPSADVASATTREIPVTIEPTTGAVEMDLTIHGVGRLKLKFMDEVDGAVVEVVRPKTFVVRQGGGDEIPWLGEGTPLQGGTYDVIVELPAEEGDSKRYKAKTVRVQEGEMTDPIEIPLYEIRHGAQEIQPK